MNAVPKVRTVNRFRYMPEIQQRRTVEHFILVYLPIVDGEKCLEDIACELDMKQVLDNFAAGDDLANGVMLKKLLMHVGDKITEDEGYPL